MENKLMCVCIPIFNILKKKKKKEPNVLKEKGLADYYLFIIKTYK